MKKITFTLSFLSLVLSPAAYFAQLSNGLMAYYTFAGSANDVSGNNHHGVLMGSPSSVTDHSGTNCAYIFSGSSSQYIALSNATDFDIAPTGAFSLSLWYVGGSTNVGDYEQFFQKTNSVGSPSALDYTLGLYDGNQISFGALYSPIVMSSVAPPIPDFTWHHTVAVYDNKKWYLYEDDALVGSDVSQTYMIYQSTGDIKIGQYFTGGLDDIRFYNRALTASEVHQLFILPASCQTSAVDELEQESNLSIYPNPVSGSFTIETGNHTGMVQLSVSDLSGRELISKNLSDSKSTIDLSTFPNGLYIIKSIENGTTSTKIIEKQ